MEFPKMRPIHDQWGLLRMLLWYAWVIPLGNRIDAIYTRSGINAMSSVSFKVGPPYVISELDDARVHTPPTFLV